MNAQDQIELIDRLCPCCGVDPVYHPLSICCDNMDLADLGAGYVMYFRMIIFFSGIWIFYLIINVIKVIANLRGSGCKLGGIDSPYLTMGLPACSADWITVHSIANYGIILVDTTEKSWVLIFFIAYWAFLSMCKAWLKRTNKLIDISNDTPSDWTIIVRNLPKDEPVEQIQANFEAFGALGRHVCPVKKVNLAFNCESYVKKHTEVNKKKRDMKLLQVKELSQAKAKMAARLDKQGVKNKADFAKRVPISDYSPEFQKKFESIKVESSELNELREQILSNPNEYGLGIAFITFRTKKIADIVEENWSTKFDFSLTNLSKLFASSKYYTYHRDGVEHKVAIRVDRAPNPNDLDWKDLGVTNTTAIQRRVITFFCTILLLGCSFGAMIGLKVAQFKFNLQSSGQGLSVDSLKFRILSIVITLVIMMINFALSKSVRYLTFAEKHWTETAFFQSLTIKIVVVCFFLYSLNLSILI